MRRPSLIASAAFGICVLTLLYPMSGCGGPNSSRFGGGGNGGNAGSGSATGGTSGVSLGGNAGSGGSGGSGGGGSCPGGGSTTVSGTIYDPAFRNPLYGINVYVPAKPLAPLPKGVPTGKDACSCGALYESGAVVATTTDINGTFTLSNVPAGSNVSLVVQIGKWRKLYHVNVNECAGNPQPDHSLSLPGAVAMGDTNDNMPDIAVSTGGADTLECLMGRIGLPPSEYVAGSSGAGHVHVFSGGEKAAPMSGYSQPGLAETNPMGGAPTSYTDLWANQGQLMPYDIVLLSCEGGETYNANPPALEEYLNAGGRVFASHFHYAWFSGPIGTTQSYSAPSDWGSNLAKWNVDTIEGTHAAGVIDKTLNGSTMPFAKGIALDAWLGVVKALGGLFTPSTDLSIFQPRYNAVVGPGNKPSQPWITSEAGKTMYFSFDTPVGAAQVCGRAVFSDLHVSGSPSTNDTANAKGGMPPPAGCDKGPLSSQEKALEFMLFDLSSCVIPDSQPPPPPDAGLPPPPK